MTQDGLETTAAAAAPDDPLVLSLDASDRNRFRPGEPLAGRVRWSLAKPPKSAQVRLFWFTQGQGERDVVVVETLALEAPRAVDDRPFSFRLPESPYSFTGKLVVIQWAVELVLMPGERTQRVQFELSPFDVPIVLGKADNDVFKPLDPSRMPC